MRRAIQVLVVQFLVTVSVGSPAAHAQGTDKEALSCDNGMVTFYISDPENRNNATFNSSAPLEDIVGTTNQIGGRLCFNPDNPQAGGRGYIEIPIASLQTGIPLRDEHLTSKDWLDAENHPYVRFDITAVKQVVETKSSSASASYDVVAYGEFSVHGKSKQIEVPARVTYLQESEQTKQRLPGDLLAARAEFEITLADFGIEGPSGKKLIGSKVGETIKIEISLVATTIDPDLFGTN